MILLIHWTNGGGKSHEFQSFATQIMTEAFRLDNRMISNAIHLFIDAWPSGWMKTIMDCRRNPKPAYFAYRNALEPMMVSLRTDRFTYVSGEKIKIEAYICNDSNVSGDYKLKFEYYSDGEYRAENETMVHIDDCKSGYAASAEMSELTRDRKNVMIRAILFDNDGNIVTYNDIAITVFADTDIKKNDDVVLIEKLPVGEHEIAGEKVIVKPRGMLPLHFVSRKTGHNTVAEFGEEDFSYWYDKDSDMITPILETTFTTEGFTPILTSGNTDDNGEWNTALACEEKLYEGKRYIICQVDLRQENPVAKRFVANLYNLK